MDLTNLTDLRAAMQLAGIKTQKSLGQHFLTDRAALEAIVTAANLTKADTVLEIGPGLGVMTEQLVERAGQVVAVETDPVLADILRKRLPANVRVEQADILRFATTDLPSDYKVVANLPYYITSKIIRMLLENDNPPASMVVLVQKEVAERITASAGHMSVLAVSVQYYAEAAIKGIVTRDKFYPEPKVDSAILELMRRPAPAFAAERAKLFRLIKAGFGEKRKQLKNALAGGLVIPVETAAALLDAAGIKATARAQELDLNDWQTLYNTAISKELL